MNGRPFATILALTVALAACDGAPEATTGPDLTAQFAGNGVVASVSGGGHYYWARPGDFWRLHPGDQPAKTPGGSARDSSLRSPLS